MRNITETIPQSEYDQPYCPECGQPSDGPGVCGTCTDGPEEDEQDGPLVVTTGETGLAEGRATAAWFLYEHPDSERWVAPQEAIGWRNQDFGAYDRGFFDGWMEIFRSIPRVPNPPCETCGVEKRGRNFSVETYCANEKCVKYAASLFGRRCRSCNAIVADCCC